MNPIINAISQGHNPQQILQFLSKAVPQLSPHISQAVGSGYQAKQILGFLSNLFDTTLTKGLSESEIHGENKRRQSEKVKSGLMLAGGALLAPVATNAIKSMFSRALPAGLAQGAVNQANAPPTPINAAQAANPPAAIPNQQPVNPTPQLGANAPQQNNQLQNIPTAPQVNPIIPTSNSPIGNVPNPGAIQPVSPPPAPVVPPMNFEPLLQKTGAKSIIDSWMQNNPPDIIATGMRGLYPTMVKDIEKESKRPFEEVINEYIANSAQTPDNSPVIQQMNQPTEENISVEEEIPSNESKVSKNIPNSIEKLLDKASKIQDPEELKRRMYVGTQEAGYDRDIQRIGRLIKSKDSLNVQDFSEEFPHEWKEAFSQYGLNTPKIQGGKIIVWRAAPENSEIEPGDYVAVTKNYAEQHLDDKLNRKKILRKIIDTKDLVNDSGDANEWIYAPKEELDYMSKMNPQKIFELSRKEHLEVMKGDSVETPKGVGEVKEVRNDKALVSIDGKIHQFNKGDLEVQPETEGNLAILPNGDIGEVESEEGEIAKVNINGDLVDTSANELEREPAGVERIIRALFNSIPEKMKSTAIASASHSEELGNLMNVGFYNGRTAWYKDVPKKIYKDISLGNYAPKTKGKTGIGEYDPNVIDSRGNGFQTEIVRNPKYSKDKEGITWGYYDKDYDFLENAQPEIYKISKEKYDAEGNPIIRKKKKAKK